MGMRWEFVSYCLNKRRNGDSAETRQAKMQDLILRIGGRQIGKITETDLDGRCDLLYALQKKRDNNWSLLVSDDEDVKHPEVAKFITEFHLPFLNLKKSKFLNGDPDANGWYMGGPIIDQAFTNVEKLGDYLNGLAAGGTQGHPLGERNKATEAESIAFGNKLWPEVVAAVSELGVANQTKITAHLSIKLDDDFLEGRKLTQPTLSKLIAKCGFRNEWNMLVNKYGRR